MLERQAKLASADEGTPRMSKAPVCTNREQRHIFRSRNHMQLDILLRCPFLFIILLFYLSSDTFFPWRTLAFVLLIFLRASGKYVGMPNPSEFFTKKNPSVFQITNKARRKVTYDKKKCSLLVGISFCMCRSNHARLFTDKGFKFHDKIEGGGFHEKWHYTE
jgi:hypothetical protein